MKTMTRRLMALLMLAVLVVSLCACSSVGKITDELDGTSWEITAGNGMASTVWSFDGDRVKVTTTATISGQTVTMSDEGDFEVEEDGVISFDWDDPDNGRVSEIYYSYEDGDLELFSDEDHDTELTKQKSGSLVASAR